MSELKADLTFVFGEECLAYKKSEADEAISELKKQVHEYAQGLYVIQAKEEKENAKLKARIAELEALNHDLCERVTENDEIRLHWEEIEQTRAENERLKARIEELEK